MHPPTLQPFPVKLCPPGVGLNAFDFGHMSEVSGIIHLGVASRQAGLGRQVGVGFAEGLMLGLTGVGIVF